MDDPKPVNKWKALEVFLRAKEREKGCTEETIKNYRKAGEWLLNFVPVENIGDVTTAMIREWINELNVSQASIRQYMARIRSLFDWLKVQDYIVKDPMEKIEAPKMRKRRISEDEWLTFDELDRTIEKARTIQERATLIFMPRTGVRLESMLNPIQFDLAGRKATVIEKGRKIRPVYFNEVCAELLKQAGIDEWPWWTPRTLRTVLTRRAKEAGIKKTVSPVTMRHTFACHARLLGIKLEDLKDLMGHAKIETTLIYADVGPTETEKASRALEAPIQLVKPKLICPVCGWRHLEV